MENINNETVNELTEIMKGLTEHDESAQDMVNNLMTLLALPDPQFEVLAPGVLQSFLQTINNPTDKITLAQTLNAMGNKLEDLTDAFDAVNTEIEKMPVSRVKKDFMLQMMGGIVSAVSETEGVSKRFVKVPIALIHPDAKIPQYANTTDSGMDVFAIEDVTIKPGETALVRTGVQVALPPGYEIQIRPKSGRALNTKLRIANAPGTIDQGYRGEIKVIVENVESPIKDISYKEVFGEDGTVDHLEVTSILYGKDYTIGKGEKFCQIVLAEVPKISYFKVDSINEDETERGAGGFGSTGIK